MPECGEDVACTSGVIKGLSCVFPMNLHNEFPSSQSLAQDRFLMSFLYVTVNWETISKVCSLALQPTLHMPLGIFYVHDSFLRRNPLPLCAFLFIYCFHFGLVALVSSFEKNMLYRFLFMVCFTKKLVWDGLSLLHLFGCDLSFFLWGILFIHSKGMSLFELFFVKSCFPLVILPEEYNSCILLGLP